MVVLLGLVQVYTIGTGQTEFSLAGTESGSMVIVRSVFRFEPDTDETDLDMRLHFTTNTATQGTGLTNFNIEKQALVMTVGEAVTYASETMISFFVGDTLAGLTTTDVVQVLCSGEWINRRNTRGSEFNCYGRYLRRKNNVKR